MRDSQTSWSQRYSAGLPPGSPALSLREFGIGAQILRDLGVSDMVMLSSSPVRMAALEGFGLKVVDSRPIAARTAAMADG